MLQTTTSLKERPGEISLSIHLIFFPLGICHRTRRKR